MPYDASRLVIKAPHTPSAAQILTDEALAFVVALESEFGAKRRALLKDREAVQAKLDAGGTLDFLDETAHIRAGDWSVRPAPTDLQDRRVEITGPVDRKMVINALNSGAKCFMADFEDSSTPTWGMMIEGQQNLKDAAAGTISYTQEETGKSYSLSDTPATLIVRPRGWHMTESHVLLDGAPISAGIFDFALYLFHSHKALAAKGSGPYYYLPKMEHYKEAALWSEVISRAEDLLGLARGTVRATILIETITAAFQMDEILYSLKDHIVGLNCGRWDYIFNVIKRFRRNPDFLLPDREAVGMTQPFLSAYSQLLIQTCHKRGAHAMGGMAAQIPIKSDEAANTAALEKVKADKEREAKNGHDGTWVAHPALIPVASGVFDTYMPTANQLDVMRTDVSVSAADLLETPKGTVSHAGLERNLEVGILYLAAWLEGKGCVPIHHLMEDAATAEICRTQLWQWRVHGAALESGETITADTITSVHAGVKARLVGAADAAQSEYVTAAADMFLTMVMSDELDEFLTTDAYAWILEKGM